MIYLYLFMFSSIMSVLLLLSAMAIRNDAIREREAARRVKRLYQLKISGTHLTRRRNRNGKQ